MSDRAKRTGNLQFFVTAYSCYAPVADAATASYSACMQVNIMPLVPPLILFMCKDPITLNFDLTSLEHVYSGAAPLGPDLSNEFLKKFPHVKTLCQGKMIHILVADAYSFAIIGVSRADIPAAADRRRVRALSAVNQVIRRATWVELSRERQNGFCRQASTGQSLMQFCPFLLTDLLHIPAVHFYRDFGRLQYTTHRVC